MPTLVVAALSARALAQSARRAGWDVVALDLFGDVDTRAAATRWLPIGDPATLRIDPVRFLGALAAARTDDCFGWIAGAGFEPHPALLESGARLLPLLGNDRATTAAVRDARAFFAALGDLGIPYPPTRFDVPSDTRGWLRKDFAGSGGWHIRKAGRAPTTADAYLQRALPGRAMSVLFIGARERALCVGINELIVRPAGARPYIYRGAIGPIEGLTASLTSALERTAEALVRRFELRGLGSLDFLLDGDAFHVLEVNPRPSATLSLYDASTPHGLLKAHVDACSGVPVMLKPAPTTTGECIVFATRAWVADASAVERLLALGCHDIPQPGSRIAADAPICSVSAHGESADAVRRDLAAREAAVLSMVQNRNEVRQHAN